MIDLAGLWATVVSHLWQSALVLGALALLARPLRSAPSGVEHSLWTVGLAKLLIPLSVGGVLAERWLQAAIASLSSPLVSLPEVWISPGRALAPAIAEAPLRPWLLALTVVWVGGCGVGLFRITRQLCAAGRILRGSRSPHARELLLLARALGGSDVDVRRIRVTEAAIGPSVIGTFRPHVVVPERVLTELPPAELRGVLEHEEAHRRRFDPARTLARRLVAALFFFFPPVAPLLRRLHETAEYACDERCLRSVDPGVYVRALARVTRLGLDAAPAPAVVGDGPGSLLVRRMRRIERSRRYHVKPIHRLAVVAAGLAVLLTSFLPLADAGSVASAPAPAPALAPAPAPAPTPASAPAPAPPPAPAAEFDEAPKVLEMVQPEYPDPAKSDGVEGLVLLRVQVDAEGAPAVAEVLQEVEGHPELTRAAVTAVQQWKFAPAKSDGVPVESEVAVPFRFALGDGDSHSKTKAADADQ